MTEIPWNVWLEGRLIGIWIFSGGAAPISGIRVGRGRWILEYPEGIPGASNCIQASSVAWKGSQLLRSHFSQHLGACSKSWRSWMLPGLGFSHKFSLGFWPSGNSQEGLQDPLEKGMVVLDLCGNGPCRIFGSSLSPIPLQLSWICFILQHRIQIHGFRCSHTHGSSPSHSRN